MMTGDVMEQRAENVLIWIDRKKNIMKLSQVRSQAICNGMFIRENKTLEVWGNIYLLEFSLGISLWESLGIAVS